MKRSVIVFVLAGLCALGQQPKEQPKEKPKLSDRDIAMYWRARAQLLSAQSFEDAVHKMLVMKCKGEPVEMKGGDPGCPGQEALAVEPQPEKLSNEKGTKP